MVIRFLEVLGVPHSEGVVDSIERVDASEGVVGSAVETLQSEYGTRAVAVYMLTLMLFGAPAGKKGRARLQELERARAVEGDPETRVPDSAAAALVEPREEEHEEDEAQQEDPTRQQSFTTLDRLLILSAVDSAQQIKGALSPDELDDVVDELVKLNGRRHQSYFHAGFRDVLFDKPVAEELSAENQSRLQWYWTGAVQGWARRERWDRIVAEYRENAVLRDLGSGSNAASGAAVRHVAEALRREGETAEIARFVKVPALLRQPSLFEQLLDDATELLGKGDAASALPIFELLTETRKELEEIGVPPTERVLLDAHRRMAHCLRQLHQHARAQKLLTDLLEQDPDRNIRAMLHADLGLIHGGFDGLQDVVLPVRRDALDGVLDRLVKGVEHFRDSVDIEARYSAHGHYCLGVLAFGRAVADHAFEDAERHLESARIHFSEAGDSYPRSLVEHANLYFGMAKAQQLSSDKLAHAADVITASLRSGARMPDYLIEPTIEALELEGQQRDLRNVTEAIIETGGSDALDRLAACDAALDHCPALADALGTRAGASGRTAIGRAADLRLALRGFVGREDWQATGEALDGLEGLARDDVAVPEFLELLEDWRRFDPVWEREDADIARARCYEDRGEFYEATRVLEALFYRLASPERPARLSDAAGVLKRIQGYGIDPNHYSGMANRYKALADELAEETFAAEPRLAAPLRVLVVGGAELQARAEDAVHRKLTESHPNIRAHFVRTGWSGNWRRPFSEIEGEMRRHDALVIMRFMRTHLGRQIRRTWDGPWRSCWGGGPGAIAEAVSRVAAAAR